MKRLAILCIPLIVAIFSYIELYSMNLASSCSGKGSFRRALNSALGICFTKPIYLITVTRSQGNCDAACGLGGVHHNRGNAVLAQADWQYITNVLSDLCVDVGVIANLNPVLRPNEANLRAYISNNIGNLRGSCKIVVFNEAFFKKTHLTNAEYTSFINGGGIVAPPAVGIIALSNACSRTIFYPNFLYERPYNNLVDQAILDRYNNAANDLIIGPDTHVNFLVPGAMPGGVPPFPAHVVPTNIVTNETYGISRGNILTTYKKRSYFREADFDIMNNNYIYDFGTGFDQASYNGANVQLRKLRDTLLKYIRTEICMDLACGVRHSNGWSNLNKDVGLLVLQSNRIDPLGMFLPSNNINHLPKNSSEHNINILYTDPIYSSRIGSNLFKIDRSGAPILFRKEMNNTATLLFDGQDHAIIEISVYRLN